MDFSWMAWTGWTIFFFCFIALSIALMGFLELRNPGGAPRYGILRLHTTRGDRLFISLIGTAFIFLAWLAFFGTPLWFPMFISMFYGFIVFRFV